MLLKFHSASEEATLALGRYLGEHAPAGTLMTLDGDLGAGKTTLVRGLGQGLGIDGPITSPTYTLMQTYVGDRLELFHFDAWMEGREKALLMDGADEFLSAGGLAVIEWGSRVAEWLPEPRLAVRLGHLTPETRTVEAELIGAGDPPSDPESLPGQLLGLLQGLVDRPLEGLKHDSDAPGTADGPRGAPDGETSPKA